MEKQKKSEHGIVTITITITSIIIICIRILY